MERILVTGTRGFVGARVMEHFKGAIAVPSDVIRDPALTSEFILANEPSLIIHTAAISDIGDCEKDHDASYKANVLLPVEIAKAAVKSKAKLLCFSSDQVYTGCTSDGPYSDMCELPEPTNTYARHKLEMEKRVLDIDPDSVHLRATWMYDMPMYNHANRGNFLANTMKAILRGRVIYASALEYRGITYVRQVAELLEKAACIPGGAYNYGSENSLTMYETTKAFLCELGLKDRCDELLKPVDSPNHNLWMDCSKLQKQGVIFDTTAEGFKRCINDYSL